MVDVVAAGRAKGVGCRRSPTSTTRTSSSRASPLPQLAGSTNTAARRGRVRAGSAPKVASWLAKYRGVHAATSRASRPRCNRTSVVCRHRRARSRSRRQDAERTPVPQAGAFQAAVSAAALMSAIAQTGRVAPRAAHAGAPALRVARARRASRSRARSTDAGRRSSGSFTPRSVSDAGALISAYGNAIDASSLSTFAGELFAATPDRRLRRSTTSPRARSTSTSPARSSKRPVDILASAAASAARRSAGSTSRRGRPSSRRGARRTCLRSSPTCIAAHGRRPPRRASSAAENAFAGRRPRLRARADRPAVAHALAVVLRRGPVDRDYAGSAARSRFTTARRVCSRSTRRSGASTRRRSKSPGIGNAAAFTR